MVLEEYIRFLKKTTSPQHPFHVCIHGITYSLFYLPLEREEAKQIELSEEINDSVSGTNEGGIVLTLWGPAYAE